MKIEKYQGCGNDFIITSEFNNDFSLLTKKICDRHLSFGADGLIYVDLNNYFVRFFNQDGTEATLCINGLRCVGLYLYKKGLFQDYIEIETIKNKYQMVIESTNPFIVTVLFPNNKYNLSKKIIKIDKDTYNLMLIDVGNKHIVCLDENLKVTEYLANLLSKKTHNCNVNFIKIINRNKIRVLTYERGAKFTLSCGSGSFASALVLYKQGLVDEIVNIEVSEGVLKVNLNKLSISGSAKLVYIGESYE